MYKILEKQRLSPGVKKLVVEAPLIAGKAKPGEFIILRLHETGERIPLTIANFDRKQGTITVIFQEVGVTTRALGDLNVGDAITDFVGPLGKHSYIEKMGTVIFVGGGIGVAPVYPIARAMQEAGNQVISIIGARSRELLILENEMRNVSSQLYITTDDGSYCRKGFVTDVLQEIIETGQPIAEVVAIGPVVMMQAVAKTTRPYGIKTIVSLNPIMCDGTGMCGGCRVSVAGETKFACVDGPEFNAHQVDFFSLTSRNRMYRDQEKYADMQAWRSGGK